MGGFEVFWFEASSRIQEDEKEVEEKAEEFGKESEESKASTDKPEERSFADDDQQGDPQAGIMKNMKTCQCSNEIFVCQRKELCVSIVTCRQRNTWSFTWWREYTRAWTPGGRTTSRSPERRSWTLEGWISPRCNGIQISTKRYWSTDRRAQKPRGAGVLDMDEETWKVLWACWWRRVHYCSCIFNAKIPSQASLGHLSNRNGSEWS